MSTSSAASTAFTGQSQFASDLQQVITRAVGIASLPLTELNNQSTTLQNQSQALTTLDDKVATLQGATTAIQSALSSPLLSSSQSTTGILSSTVQANASPGVYTVEVLDVGSYSSALSQAGTTAVSDPTKDGISSSLNYTLTIGGVPTSITSASSSLNDLVTAINTQSSGSVQATVVNVGGSGAPDYRISFRSTKLGPVDIGLSDGTNDEISSQTAGSLASYKVNGYSTAVTSDTRTATIAPGLQVQLLSDSASGQATTITVSQDASSIQNAFSSFATAYNAVVDELATSHGQTAGALQGDSIVSTVSSALRAISSFSNGTPDSSLAAFGITLDSAGHLSVDATAFQAGATANYQGLLSVIGSKSSGFLQTATNTFNGLEDLTTGSIKLEEAQVVSRISSTQAQILKKQDTINLLQSNLQQQIAAADAAIATLEQQASYLTNMFASQRTYATQGY